MNCQTKIYEAASAASLLYFFILGLPPGAAGPRPPENEKVKPMKQQRQQHKELLWQFIQLNFPLPRDVKGEIFVDVPMASLGLHTTNLLINWSTSESNRQLNQTTCLGDTDCWIQQVTAPTLIVTCWIQPSTCILPPSWTVGLRPPCASRW